MYKGIITALAVGLAAVTPAQTTVFDSSAGSYGTGDLNGQNNWTQLLIHDSGGPLVSNQLSAVTFSVDNTQWVANDAASDTAFLVETNASYVYLNEPSAGNELYSEWTGEMDFSFRIPAGTYAGAGTLPNANFFAIGLTSSTTNGLSQFQQDDVVLFLRYRANNRLDMQLQTEQDADLRIFQTPSDGTTWAEPAGAEILGMNPQTGDCQSDELHLSWTLRKTTDGNYLAWGSVSNKATGAWVDDVRTNGLGGKVVSTQGKGKSAAVYAATDPVLAMGRHTAAHASQYEAFGNGLLDIDIEDLVVTKSTVAPVLAAPTGVTPSPYDGQVTLSWDAVAEAASYDVFRATSSGGYTIPFTNLTELSVVDDGLSNGVEYFYIVQAVYPGFANSGDSAEVSAIPSGVLTGTLVDTDFFSYANGDLVNDADWGPVSGSSNNAFNVMDSGTANAAIDTVSTAASFSTNTGNAVYLTTLTDNVTYDAWSGHFDFQVSAVGTDINNQDVFVFGVSANNSDSLHLEDNDDMALMSLKVRANGKLVAMFGTELNDTEDTRLAVLIGAGETGWDPANNATTLNTDWIRYNWEIRKTGVDGVYQAFGSFSNMTQSVTNPAQVGTAFLTLDRQGLYDNPSATFVMGHYYKAIHTPGQDRVDVTIRSMSVSHSSGNTPAPVAPVVMTEGSDRTVTVSWDEVFEATGYDVFFGESSNAVTTLIDDTTSTQTIDAPRYNDVTGYYRVRANFDGDIADSDIVAGTPEASALLIDVDGFANPGLIDPDGDSYFSRTAGLATGTVTYIDYTSTALITNGAFGKYHGPDFYGITSLEGVAADITAARGNQGYRITGNSTANGLTTDNFDYAPKDLWGDLLWYVQESDWLVPGAIDAVASTVTIKWSNKHNTTDGSHRAAIRNGSTWYVSESDAALDGDLSIVVADENWAVLSVVPGADLVDPAPNAFDNSNNSTFTDINAVGWFVDHTKKVKPHKLVLIVSGSSVSSPDYWAQHHGVTNLYEDIDGDLLDNIKEYAYGGDPNDGNDVGVLPEFFTPYLYNGTNGFIVTHVEQRDPNAGIGYALETTDDLVNDPFATGEAEEIGRVKLDYFWDSVTSFIPSESAAKYVDLKITED